MKTKIKTLISALLIANLSEAAIMPMPIIMPINSNGGASPEIYTAPWIALNILLVIGLCIRFFFNKKDRRFSNQSSVKNFFYELEENTIEQRERQERMGLYFNTSFNPIMIGFFTLNIIALAVWLSLFILDLIS